METLESRVEKLERENRRLKRGALLALAVIGGVVVMGQASAPVVSEQLTTRRLAVVNEAGQTRAVLSGAGLVLGGEPGEGVASIVVGKNGPALMLSHDREKPQILLTVLTDGPHLELLDTTLETRVSIVAGKGGSGLTLFNEAGTAQAALAVLKNGPTLAMYDQAKARRVELSAFKEGPSLKLVDEAGRLRLGLYAYDRGPELKVTDATEKVRLALGVHQGGPGIVMFNERGGKPLWAAPGSSP